MRGITLEQMQGFAGEIAQSVSSAPKERGSAFVIFLRGELGAGKTTFMQALARELGVEHSIHSPTFSLMKIYPIDFHGFQRLIHIDAYRLNGAEDFCTLAPDTFLHDPTAIVCIEWPGQVGDALPKPDIDILFTHPKEDGGQMREVLLSVGVNK